MSGFKKTCFSPSNCLEPKQIPTLSHTKAFTLLLLTRSTTKPVSGSRRVRKGPSLRRVLAVRQREKQVFSTTCQYCPCDDTNSIRKSPGYTRGFPNGDWGVPVGEKLIKHNWNAKPPPNTEILN